MTLKDIEYILGSGSGLLDFAVMGELEYYTWEGAEDTEWIIEDVEYIENGPEDRFFVYPKEDNFVCTVEIASPEEDHDIINCWCE